MNIELSREEGQLLEACLRNEVRDMRRIWGDEYTPDDPSEIEGKALALAKADSLEGLANRLAAATEL